MSFVEKIIKTSATPFIFIRSRANSGRRCYYVVACSKEKASLLEKNVGRDNIDLTSFGKVVAYGYGDNPDNETIERIKKHYGCDLSSIL